MHFWNYELAKPFISVDSVATERIDYLLSLLPISDELSKCFA
jgi:hypothetical protein